jgi:hypothetical protein
LNSPPFFIVGCARSGTTLLRDLLRSHPRLSIPTESHFIPAFYQCYGNPQSARQAVMIARAILRLQYVRAWDLPVSEEMFSDCRTFAEIITRIYQAWAHKEGKPHWGDKTPNYVTRIPLLAEAFTDARFIHIYRDGRDVARSWIRAKFGPQNVFTAARDWHARVTAGRQSGRELPRNRYLEVKYETLLKRPEETMRQVCLFLGESYDPAVLSRNILPPRRRPSIFGSRDLGLRDRAIVPTNCAKWKVLMSCSDQILFESVAGDLLQELGYEVNGQTRDISRLERLGWKGHDYFWLYADRLNKRDHHKWFLSDLRIRLAWRGIRL